MKCEHCGKSQSSIVQLRKHIYDRHNLVVNFHVEDEAGNPIAVRLYRQDGPNGYFLCFGCLGHYSLLTTVRRHILKSKTCHLPTLTSYLNASNQTDTPASLPAQSSASQSSELTTYQLSESSTSHSPESSKYHLSESSPSQSRLLPLPNISETSIECMLCHECFQTPETLDEHHRERHTLSVRISISVSHEEKRTLTFYRQGNQNGTFQCPSCHSAFEHIPSFSSHIQRNSVCNARLRAEYSSQQDTKPSPIFLVSRSRVPAFQACPADSSSTFESKPLSESLILTPPSSSPSSSSSSPLSTSTGPSISKPTAWMQYVNQYYILFLIYLVIGIGLAFVFMRSDQIYRYR